MADGEIVETGSESGDVTPAADVGKETILGGDPTPAESDVVADDEKQIAESARIAESGTDEEKAAEAARVAEKEKGAGDALPEVYEFNMPEGMEIDKALVETIEPLFKDLKLTQEQANKFTDAFAASQQAAAVANDDSFASKMSAWNKELKEDATFGGEKFEENSAQVKDFIKKTIPDDIKDEFSNMLYDSGLGNNPTVVKYLFALSNQFSTMEDNPGGGGPQKEKGDIASRMYNEDGSPTKK